MMVRLPLFDNAIFINLTLGRDNLEKFIQSQLIHTPELDVIEWYALRVLFMLSDSITLTDLAELFGKKPNSFSDVVKNLKKHNYITKKQHPFDHRKKILELTDKAKQIRNNFLAHAHDLDAKISAYIGDIHIQHMLQILLHLQQLPV